MALQGVNRYADLIKSIVGGSFYASKGTVLPYRSTPTELRVATQHPNTQYGVYVNGVYIQSVYSDPNGNVTFSCQLERGDVELVLVNIATDQRFSSYVTVREYALWLAAYAEVLESIDDDWLVVKDSLSMQNARIRELEEVYGTSLGIYNNLGQDTNGYRYMLMEVRDAFRTFGGRFRGVDMLVSAITQIPPFGYSRRHWGPNWVLDQSMLGNHRLTQRAAALAYSSTAISGVQLSRVEADVPSGISPTYNVTYDATAKTLQWGLIANPKGPAVSVVAGEMFLPGPSAATSYLLGLKTSVYLNLSRERYLYLNVGSGTVVVDLSPFTSPTISALVSVINARVPGLASSYNSKLLLSGNYPFIHVEPGYMNAAARVFGVMQGDIQLPSVSGIPGVTLISAIGPAVNQGYLDILGPVNLMYDATLKKLKWWTSGAAGIPVDVSLGGTFTLTDSLGAILSVHVHPGDLPLTSTGFVTISLNFSRIYVRPPQTRGLWVNTTPSLLPATSGNFSVLVSDAATGSTHTTAVVPDSWHLAEWTSGGSVATLEPSAVITDRDDGFSPCTAFRYVVRDTVLTTLRIVGKPLISPLPGAERGSIYPPKASGLFYDYEGFEAIWSGWFLNHNSSGVSVTLGFSFDGGATWREGVETPIASDTGTLGYESPTYVAQTILIPGGLEPGEVRVRATFVRKSGASLPKVSMDAPRIDIRHITSRALANTTVVRTRHRQNMGELLFVWSKTPLTLTEQKYLGTLYKSPDLNEPLSGVSISSVSMDTPAGSGKIEHQLDAGVHQLRWAANGESRGVSGGWVSAITNAAFVLGSPLGSSLTVQVTVGNLPTGYGFKNVVISDYSVQQGSVREAAPAHSTLDIIDATEYGPTKTPLNLVGIASEGDYSYADLVNLNIFKDDSALNKYAFLYPKLGPVVDEELDFSVSAPHNASLVYACDQDKNHAVLKENGIPFPDDLWAFTGAQQVQILNTVDFDSTASYTLSYSPLYQVTTPTLSLGNAFKNYMWLADYLRMTTVSLLVDPDNGIAELANASSLDKNTSTLYYETESGRREIPRTAWDYISDTLVQIDPAYYITRAIYIFTYSSRRMLHEKIATVKFEHRSGENSSACLAATWVEVQRNENVEVSPLGVDHAMHQLRLSIGGITGDQDFRIRSLVLKGLNIIGPSAVKGLLNV
jgi:hypothetical protein